jgi:hypothetical protein
VPVRAIKRLEAESLMMYMPQAVVASYIELGDNTFEILVERHFDKYGNVLRTIGERVHCSWYREYGSRSGRPYFILQHHPLIRKYGVLSNEYLEGVYENKIHERGLIFKKVERNAIFPEREVEESDLPSE